jgi:hypothetical protein
MVDELAAGAMISERPLRETRLPRGVRRRQQLVLGGTECLLELAGVRLAQRRELL